MGTELLIIDDNIKLGKSLGRNFDLLGYTSYYATNSKAAFEILPQANIKVVLLDIVLGEEDGIEVLNQLLQKDNKLPVIMITGYGSIETAVKSVKLGAFDYVQKPLNFDKLLTIVENAVKLSHLKQENQHLKDRIIELSSTIVTRNPQLLEVCEKARRLAATDIPVLIYGANGTGKELIAQLIHSSSKRNAYKLNTINCAAFPESLLDNELFGHEKGAFTGADNNFIGIFEKSDKSTLHLDELGDMALATQAKILRTLQNNEIRRIGGSRNITVDVRFIASTNKDLEKMIEEKRFREDLFYRLNAATLKLPPLRERLDDLPLLINHFLQQFSENNSKQVNSVSTAVLQLFGDYDWPGNIRELKNTLNYAATMASNDCINLEDLPASLVESRTRRGAYNPIDESEKTLILKILKQTHHNKKKAAEVLKISRKTLYNKMSKYGISS